MRNKILLIGACCGNNCGPQPGCQWGPVEFFKRIADNPLHALHGIETKLVYEHWCRSRTLDHYEGTGQFVADLAAVVKQAKLDGYFPIVVGGDHSCAIGTWRGVSQAIGSRLGMVWMDAHLDSHTDLTSHSGAIHGMPVAALTNNGHSALKSDSVEPARLCHIGARSYEPEEQAYAEKMGFDVLYFGEGNEHLLEVSNQEILITRGIAKASVRGGMPFGISIDLDGIDPLYAPAVSCPEPGGISPHAIHNAFEMMSDDELGMLQAFEIVEYNPCISTHSDADRQKTFETLSTIIYVVVERLRNLAHLKAQA